MTAQTTAPAYPAAPHHAGAHVSTLTSVAARLPLTSAALAARRTAAGPAPALARTLLDWHSDDVDECGPEAVAAILSAPAVPTGLRIVHGIHWPPHPGAAAPPLAGFTVSSFNPLVAAAAEQCLGQRPAPPQPRRTALLLASHTGDRATGAAIRDAVGSGRTVPPLLFFQSNPNAVLGHVAARWQLTGPVVAISRPARIIGLTHEVLAEAAVLLHDGDADEVLVIVAEQGRTPAEPDEAVAALVALRG